MNQASLWRGGASGFQESGIMAAAKAPASNVRFTALYRTGTWHEAPEFDRQFFVGGAVQSPASIVGGAESLSAVRLLAPFDRADRPLTRGRFNGTCSMPAPVMHTAPLPRRNLDLACTASDDAGAQ